VSWRDEWRDVDSFQTLFSWEMVLSHLHVILYIHKPDLTATLISYTIRNTGCQENDSNWTKSTLFALQTWTYNCKFVFATYTQTMPNLRYFTITFYTKNPSITFLKRRLNLTVIQRCLRLRQFVTYFYIFTYQESICRANFLALRTPTLYRVTVNVNCFYY